MYRLLVLKMFVLCVVCAPKMARAQEAEWHELATTGRDKISTTHPAIVWGNELLIIGSYRSIDARAYTTILTSPNKLWIQSAVAEFNGKLWNTAGGITESWTDETTKVWSSQDGATWKKEAGQTCCNRSMSKLLSHENSLWLIGGEATDLDGDNPDIYYYNDVWRSTDGVNWDQIIEHAPWAPRGGHGGVVFDGRMWVIGGFSDENFNDVWSSTDGLNWTAETLSAPWSKRKEHATAIHDGKIWVLGGRDETDLADVWYSNDGINWTMQTDAAPWGPRRGHVAISFKEELLVLDGYGPGLSDRDVWAFGITEGEGEGEGTAEGEGEGIAEGEGTAEGAVEGEDLFTHASDVNEDGRLNLSELLRVIQLFNSDGFHCGVAGVEDGYATGPGDISCAAHSADYEAPADFMISLGELLRVIQIFNSAGYVACPGAGTEDGFCILTSP